MFALSEFDIRYQPAKAVKGQALADLIADRINTDVSALFVRAWAMFFDGLACDDGCGIGILLVSPRGETYSFSIKMATPCTNNLVEYEAIRKGMELLLEAVTPSFKKDINRAIIYMPGSSHTYIQHSRAPAMAPPRPVRPTALHRPIFVGRPGLEHRYG